MIIINQSDYYILKFKHIEMEELLDPYGDRVMKNVPMIARLPLPREELWTKTCTFKLRSTTLEIEVELP